MAVQQDQLTEWDAKVPNSLHHRDTSNPLSSCCRVGPWPLTTKKKGIKSSLVPGSTPEHGCNWLHYKATINSAFFVVFLTQWKHHSIISLWRFFFLKRKKKISGVLFLSCFQDWFTKVGFRCLQSERLCHTSSLCFKDCGGVLFFFNLLLFLLKSLHEDLLGWGKRTPLSWWIGDSANLSSISTLIQDRLHLDWWIHFYSSCFLVFV